MKKVLLVSAVVVVAVMLMLVGNIWAGSTLNPDKYPSIAVRFGQAKLDNSYSYGSYFGDFDQDGKSEADSITLDLRLPISDRVTVSFDYSFLDGKSSTMENNYFYSNSLN